MAYSRRQYTRRVVTQSAAQQWVDGYMGAILNWYWRRAVLPGLLFAIIAVLVMCYILPGLYSDFHSQLPNVRNAQTNLSAGQVVYGIGHTEYHHSQYQSQPVQQGRKGK